MQSTKTYFEISASAQFFHAFMMIAALPFILLVAPFIFLYNKLEQVFSPFLNIPSYSGKQKRSGDLATSAAARKEKGVIKAPLCCELNVNAP